MLIPKELVAVGEVFPPLLAPVVGPEAASAAQEGAEHLPPRIVPLPIPPTAIGVIVVVVVGGDQSLPLLVAREADLLVTAGTGRGVIRAGPLILLLGHLGTEGLRMGDIGLEVAIQGRERILISLLLR